MDTSPSLLLYFTNICGYIFIFCINLFIYLFLAVLGLRCCEGFSLVAASGGYSLLAVHGLLIVVTALVVEHGFE